MQQRKRLKQALPIDRSRLMNAYRQVVSSVREARDTQSLPEKERQVQWLMRYMRPAEATKP